MFNFLGVNISQFDEDSYISETGELDVERVINDYSSENEDTDYEEVDDVETEDYDSDDDYDDIDEETPEVQDTDQQKRTSDQAFAEMRRKAEANEPIAKWVQDLANQQGYSDPSELMAAYKEQQDAHDAEQQGIPVDLYRRMNDLETENKTAKEQITASNFNNEVAQVKQKYNLTDEQLTETFNHMGQRNMQAGDVPFEVAYIAANHDTIVKDAEERGRQSYLEQKQQKQKQSTPHLGTNSNDRGRGDDLDTSREGILNMYAEMGIDI